jgi:hypothetical protein
MSLFGTAYKWAGEACELVVDAYYWAFRETIEDPPKCSLPECMADLTEFDIVVYSPELKKAYCPGVNHYRADEVLNAGTGVTFEKEFDIKDLMRLQKRGKLNPGYISGEDIGGNFNPEEYLDGSAS